MTDIFKRNNLTDEEILQQLSATPEQPMMKELASPMSQDIKQQIANENVNSEVENPYIQPTSEESPKVDMTGIDEASAAAQSLQSEVPPESPVVPEKSTYEKLMEEYRASKSEAGNRRSRAEVMDAFDQINRSIAGRAGNKITGGPSQVSQLPKDDSLAELMAKYNIGKGQRDQELKNKKIESDKVKAAAKPTVVEKELAKADAKETIQIKKENRKMRKDMEDSIPALDEQLKNIKEAKAALKAAKGFAGTGPIDQYASKFTDQGQKLEQALNKISLNTMVKMFSGMSKAIDSDAERAFFQSAQPAMNKYETVNEDILSKMEENIMSLKDKSKAAMKSIDASGNKKEMPMKEDTATKMDERPQNKAQAHDRRSEAEQWAMANPEDPRAQEILRRLGK